MAIRYEVTSGALPVTVYLMQGLTEINHNVHNIYEEGQFDDVVYGEYTLYAVDNMLCEWSLNLYPFIFAVNVGNGETITLPLSNGYNFSFWVDYGDSTPLQYVTTYNGAGTTHTYTNAGIYEVTITGTCQSFYCNNTATIRTKIVEVIQWGTMADFLQLNFYGCTNLADIPDGAITAAPNITNYDNLFRDCSSLTVEIPESLFSQSPLVSIYAFRHAFRSSGVTGSIPEDLFIYNELASEAAFESTFRSCTGLTGSIPEGLFRNNRQVSDRGFLATFYYCSNLTGSIPEDLFINNTLVGVYGFGYTFAECVSLTGMIPSNLFKYNTIVSSRGFFATFANCESIQGISAGLFDYNPEVSDWGFAYTFTYCISMNVAIPANLFDNNRKVSDYAFVSTFYQSYSIPGGVPADFFKYNTEAGIDAFNYTFQVCAAFTDPLPIDLFRYNVNVNDDAFYQTFMWCQNMGGDIPEDLFRYNTGISGNAFAYTFEHCEKLESMPPLLFYYNKNVTGYQFVFTDCYTLQFHRNVFCPDDEEATFFHDKSINFEQSFYRIAPYYGVIGEAPHLWDFDYGTGVPNKLKCFYREGNSCLSLINYPDIPADWGGMGFGIPCPTTTTTTTV